MLIVSAVAIAYLMQKTPYVFPILGGRKVEHLVANIEALDIALTDEHMKYLESVVPFDPGFPNFMIVRPSLHNSSSSLILVNRAIAPQKASSISRPIWRQLQQFKLCAQTSSDGGIFRELGNPSLDQAESPCTCSIVKKRGLSASLCCLSNVRF